MRNSVYSLSRDRAETTQLRGPTFDLSLDGGVGLREVAGAAFESRAFSYRSISRSENLKERIVPQMRRLAELTGNSQYATLLGRGGVPALDGLPELPRDFREVESTFAASSDQILALRKQGAKDLKIYEEIQVDIAAKSDRLDARAADMTRRGGPGAGVAEFFGGMAAVMADPINLALLPLGATAGATILRIAMTEAGINVMAEGFIQPSIWSYQNELGRDYGAKDVIAALLMAAGGGFLFGGAIAGVRRAAQIAGLRGKTGDLASAYRLAVEQGRMGATSELNAAARVFREAADVVDESPMPSVDAHQVALQSAEEALLSDAPVDVSPVITPLRDRLQGTLQTAFDLTDDEVEATLTVADSFAQRWARDRGMEPGDWYEQAIAGVTKGVVPESKAALFQAPDTPAFRAWFGDSVMREGDGTPRVVYHQTAAAVEPDILESGFDITKGRARLSDERVPEGFFFKPDKKDIGVGAIGNDATQVPVYLSMKRPFRVESAEELQYKVALADPVYGELGADLRELNTRARTANAEIQKMYRRGPKGMSPVPRSVEYGRLLKKEEAQVTAWIAEEQVVATRMRERITAYLKAGGHDGVIILHDAGSVGRRTETYVVLEPTQIKSANLNRGTFDPTNPSLVRQGVKGAVEFLEDGRAVIRALHNPDVSTAMHELSHVFRRSLSNEHLAVASKWAGVEPEKWTVPAEEKFARGFERYLRDGKAPTPALREVFERFREWLKGIYRTIKGTPIDVQLNKDIRRVFTEMLGGRVPEPAVKGRAEPKTLVGHILRRGGIDAKLAGKDFNIREDFQQAGAFGVLRKGGRGLDDMAQTLHEEGIIQVPSDRAPDDYLVELLGTAEGRRSVKAAEQVTDEAERMSAEYVQGQNEDFAAGRIDENAETARVHDQYEQLVEDDLSDAMVTDGAEQATGEPVYRSAREAVDELEEDNKYLRDLAACVRGGKR